MQVSVLQLNLFANKFKNQLFPYLQANNFDVLLFQEITGPNTKFGNIVSPEDNYKELQDILGVEYHNALSVTDTFSAEPTSYFANGIFYRKDFTLINREEIFMHKNEGPFPSESKTYQDIGRSILALELQKENKRIHFLTTHFAWGGTPIEQKHQTEQGEVMLKYLETINKPFVFTGDFNINPQQPTIQKLSQLARNLITENNITNTLNPNTHAAQHMFPKGAAVDYMFVSEDIKVNNFEVIHEDISDHLGLRAVIEF